MAKLFKFNTLVNEVRLGGPAKNPAQKAPDLTTPDVGFDKDQLTDRVTIARNLISLQKIREAARIIKNQLSEEEIVALLEQAVFLSSDEEG